MLLSCRPCTYTNTLNWISSPLPYLHLESMIEDLRSRAVSRRHCTVEGLVLPLAGAARSAPGLALGVRNDDTSRESACQLESENMIGSQHHALPACSREMSESHAPSPELTSAQINTSCLTRPMWGRGLDLRPVTLPCGDMEANLQNAQLHISGYVKSSISRRTQKNRAEQPLGSATHGY